MPGQAQLVATNYTHISGAATTTVFPVVADAQRVEVRILHAVIVNKGATSGTVTVRLVDDTTIAVIDAANPDIGRRFDLAIADGLEIVTVGTGIDVTVLWS